ncbi:hypothetical protein STRIP9103_01465 [Streptomyces ipomoeae 91-03]|uniref:Uncharacterized protein n=1 Tax=Streptomyces ipomoeae 91-03 TaxID=698759 RepID=L1KKG9_9ACTN|nr:hypothetical protein STRIP9103_01465 [Streptomyces ipomoeae 91-03]
MNVIEANRRVFHGNEPMRASRACASRERTGVNVIGTSRREPHRKPTGSPNA